MYTYTIKGTPPPQIISAYVYKGQNVQLLIKINCTHSNRALLKHGNAAVIEQISTPPAVESRWW